MSNSRHARKNVGRVPPMIWGALLLGVLTILATTGGGTTTIAQSQPQITGDLSTLAGAGESQTGVASVEPKTDVFVQELSFAEVDAQTTQIRAEQEAAKAGKPRPFVPVPEGAPAREGETSAPTEAGHEGTANALNDIRFFRNHDISSTEVSTGQRSTVMEPTTINLDNAVFYTGNWFAAKSTDGGNTFSYLNPYTMFPSVQNGFCCDQVSAYAPGQDMALWALQYVNNSTTNTLRIARAIGANGISNNQWVYYDFTPQMVGFASGIWFDYPSMTVGTNFVYVTSNAFTTSTNSFAGNVVMRLPLSNIAAGTGFSFNYFRSGIGTERLTEGAGTTMYWLGFTTTTQMRIHRWDEGSGTVYWDNVNLYSFYWLNRDGVATSPDGTNWALRADSRPTAAYVAGGIIGAMWSAKQGSGRPKPYTVHARFSQSTRALVSQGDIWHTDYAWMYPAVMPNAVGHLAGSLQIGGAASGTFAYPGTQMWIADDVTPLTTSTITSPFYVSSGNDGPNNNAWGDYFTVRVHKTRPRTWVAASHTLQGGGSGSNAVPKYLWVGRERDNPTNATMSSPSPGSTLPGSSATFTWTPGYANLQYWLYIGTTGVGSYNIWNQDQGLTTSRLVSGLPTNGAAVYVRLWTRTSLGWGYIDYTYTAATTVTCVRAAMTSPAPGATLPGSSATFNWNAGTSNTQYWLYLGTTAGGAQLYNASQGTGLTRTVGNLPTDGKPLYATLWSYCNSSWQYYIYEYAAYTVRATLQSPAAGSVLSASQTFSWFAGLGSTQYWIYIGSSLGAADIRNQNMGTARTVSGVAIPADGRRVYLRLWSLAGGLWYYTDYRFTAPGTARARLTTPIEESVLPGSSVTFNWAAGSSSTQYWIYLGSSLGAADLSNQNRGTNLNASVTGLPTDRRPLYLRLWSLAGGLWVYNDYVFYAYDGGSTRARIIDPVSNTVLVGSSTTFRWSAGSGATQYWIYIGSSRGAANYRNQNMGTALSVVATGLPTNGTPVWVRMWSLVGGLWVYNDYEYKAAP